MTTTMKTQDKNTKHLLFTNNFDGKFAPRAYRHTTYKDCHDDFT